MQDVDILAESWDTLESDGRQVSWLSRLSLSRSPRIRSLSLIDYEDYRFSTTSTAIAPYLQTLHHRLAGPTNQSFSTKTQRQDQGFPSG